MKIELRKVSVNHRLSEETLCFAADIWIDGKMMGAAKNHGHGGSTDYWLGANFDTEDRRDLEAKAKDAARAWIEANGTDEDRRLIAPHVRDDGTSYTLDPLEFLIDLLVEQHERKKADAKTAKVEAKNAAAFAAAGKPWMLRVEFHGSLVWYGLPNDSATTVERALAQAAKKYGEVVKHAVVPTRVP